MKKFYLFSFMILIVSYSFAQVSVTATSGTPGPTAYTTLKSAFDAVNTGTHQGVITITINGVTTETISAVLNGSGNGSASYTGLSIKPTGGVASTITGNIAAPLIDLNGASNITIDGLNSGGNSLTISNTNAGNASTIRYINDAANNTIQNTAIQGAGASTTSGTVYFSTGITIGNSNNTISNCDIADATGNFPANAIYSAGNAIAGQENKSNTIVNNNISNFFNPTIATVGILISTGNTDWTISTNKLFQSSARTFTVAATHRAIQITAGNNYNITGNTMGYASSSASGTYTLGGGVATRFIAIDIAVGSTVASSIQNNTIANFSLSTTSGAGAPNGIWCGINITAGDVNVGTVTGNTIGNTTGTGSISVSSSTGGAFIVPINCSSTGNISISKNNIGSIDLLPTAALSGTINCIQTSGASGNIFIINNTIGNSTANNIRVGIFGTTTGNGNMRGIFNTNLGIITITSNTIRNLTHNSNNALALFRAMECQQGKLTIIGNSISNITANGAATTALTPEGVGIAITNAPVSGLIIDQNTIFNLNATNSTPATGPVIMGIYLSSAVADVSVTRNKIYGFTNAGTATTTTSTNQPPIIAGIYCRDATAVNPNILIANNMISFGNAQTTNTSMIGIWNAASSTTGLTMKIYYNSINIEGTVATGAQPSFCYYRGDFTASFASPVVDIRDNIFTNTRSGGTGKHYAIANSYGNATSSATGWTSDYNVLNATPSTIGYWSGDQTFAGWQTVATGDAHSLSGIHVEYVNSASDLHLVTSSNGFVDGKATPIATVTTDFDNNPRDAVTPDLGADEFTATVLAITTEYFKGSKQSNANVLNWKAACSSPSVKFDIERSAEGRSFINIGAFSATQARCSFPFDFTDNNPLPGLNYYRLKMTDSDGKIYYSIIIAIINKEKGFEIVGLLPTLVNDVAVLNVTSAERTSLQIVVTDVSGRSIQKQAVTVEPGSNSIRMNFATLSAGKYQLSGYTDNGVVKTISFVKR